MKNQKGIYYSLPSKLAKEILAVMGDLWVPGVGTGAKLLAEHIFNLEEEDFVFSEDSNENNLINALLLKKIVEDFKYFVGNNKSNIKRIKDVNKSRYLALPGRTEHDFNNQLLFEEPYIFDDALFDYFSIELQQKNKKCAIELNREFKIRKKPIKISCSPIEPSHIAVLTSLKSNQRYGLNIKIDYSSITGVYQISNALSSAEKDPPDFLITANPAFNLKGSHFERFKDYYLVMELHTERQVVMFRKNILKKKPKELYVFKESSAHEQQILGIGIPDNVQVILPNYFEDLVPLIKETGIMIAWEPLASFLKNHGWREADDSLSQYPILISLYCYKDWKKSDLILLKKFLNLYISEWIFCMNNIPYTMRLLLINEKFKRSFKGCTGIEIHDPLKFV